MLNLCHSYSRASTHHSEYQFTTHVRLKCQFPRRTTSQESHYLQAGHELARCWILQSPRLYHLEAEGRRRMKRRLQGCWWEFVDPLGLEMRFLGLWEVWKRLGGIGSVGLRYMKKFLGGRI